MTGTGTPVGPTGIMGDNGPAVRALAIKSTGEVYALSHEASSDLYRVNATTGAGTFLVNTVLLYPGDIVFDQNDVLYAVDQSDMLYVLNPENGAATVIGPTGISLAGLACDPTSGTLYGSSGSTDQIYLVSKTTGEATLVGSTGLGSGTTDIHFDQNGNLFGSVRGSGDIYDYVSIDKSSGVGSIVGPTGFYAVVGLAARLEFVPTHIDEPDEIPLASGLDQNYPNPFNPETAIRFQISDYRFVSLRVYDVLGREVATIVDEQLSPGTYTRQWDARDMASGVYVYRLTAGAYTESKRMVLMK